MQASLILSLAILPFLAGLARADLMPADQVNPDGHTRDVLAVAFTPDGKKLATAGRDGEAKIWDVATASVEAKLGGHSGDVFCVAIAPDGKTIATGGEDRTIRLWATKGGTSLGQLSGHSGPVAGLAFAPDGKTLASASFDATIRLWDVRSRRPGVTLKGHTAGVRGVAFSPDGKSLASASHDHTVKLWDVAAGKELSTLGSHQDRAWCVAFAPDGKTVVSGGRDKTVRFWDIDPPDRKSRETAGNDQGPPPVVPLRGDGLAVGAGSWRQDSRCFRVGCGATAAGSWIDRDDEVLRSTNQRTTQRPPWCRPRTGVFLRRANTRLGWRRPLDPALGRGTRSSAAGRRITRTYRAARRCLGLDSRAIAAGHLARPVAARASAGSDHDPPGPGRGPGDYAPTARRSRRPPGARS